MSRVTLFDLARLLLSRRFRRLAGEAATVPPASQPAASVENSPQAKAPYAPAAPYSPANSPRRVGAEGIALIKSFEGIAKLRADGLFEAYPDPGTGGDPWTIGWGATGAGIARGTAWTQGQCDARLEADLARYASDVERALGDAPTSQSQFDAMVSFHYNTGAIARATLTRKHKAGDFAGAAREFDRWSYAGGRVMKGLARRRAAEAALYRRG